VTINRFPSSDHGRPQKFFHGGQCRHFGYAIHIVDNTMKVDVNKTLFRFVHHKENALTVTEIALRCVTQCRFIM